MINLNEYPLIYYRKLDAKKFHVKRATSTDYVLVDSETFEKIRKSHFFLRKEFFSDKECNLSYVKSINQTA
jgi:hypothetical protein